MLRVARPGRTSRRAATLVATGALALALAGCSSESENTSATDSALGGTPSATPSTEAAPVTPSPSAEVSSPSTAASEPAAGSEPGAKLPAWAPKIITDADDNVTGLDFSGTPAPSDKLLIADVTKGDGPAVEKGQTITADYFGQLPEETEPFDESYSSQPFQAPIGVGSLIPGWDQALVGVPVGSRVVMSIPPDLGYGATGSGPIPGGATLFFVIDIISAQ